VSKGDAQAITEAVGNTLRNTQKTLIKDDSVQSAEDILVRRH
jgi:hypothetical protein